MTEVSKFHNLVTNVRKNFIATLNEDLRSGTINLCSDEHFILILKTANTVCGINRKELAYVYGIKESTLCNWISGRSVPGRSKRPLLVLLLCSSIENQIKNDSRRNQYVA